MQYPALLLADWHLTDNPRDEYRWALFPWLTRTCLEEKVKTLIVLGDLTDSKDNHSARLTNRVVEGFRDISNKGLVRDVKVLAGNHDWLLGGQEFFRFLSVIPGVQYISAPCEDPDVTGQPAFYLPYSRNPARDWKGLDLSHYKYVFMHQTLKGARSSNGQELEGEELPDMTGWGKIYSGDVHPPQVIGPLEYVGSPMHIHFGDRFVPRLVLLERGGRATDLHFPSISRVTVRAASARELERHEFRAGDQVKLRVALPEAEKHEWQRRRRECTEYLKAQGVEVAGVELVLEKSARRLRVAPGNAAARPALPPADVVAAWARAEELTGDALDVALEVIG